MIKEGLEALIVIIIVFMLGVLVGFCLRDTVFVDPNEVYVSNYFLTLVV